MDAKIMRALKIEGKMRSNDFANRLQRLGACWSATQWARSARHLSLRAMWNLCPRGSWLAWIIFYAARRHNYRYVVDSENACLSSVHPESNAARWARAAHAVRTAVPWEEIEPLIKKWLGLK